MLKEQDFQVSEQIDAPSCHQWERTQFYQDNTKNCYKVFQQLQTTRNIEIQYMTPKCCWTSVTSV